MGNIVFKSRTGSYDRIHLLSWHMNGSIAYLTSKYKESKETLLRCKESGFIIYNYRVDHEKILKVRDSQHSGDASQGITY